MAESEENLRADGLSGSVIEVPFEAPWWLRQGDLQTLAGALPRRLRSGPLRVERIELPDGDFVDLAWAAGATAGPTVLLVHGLGGSARSPYARGLLDALTRRGWRAAVFHFRGCSGVSNRLERSYHSGDTADLARVITLLRVRLREAPLAVVGFSLGGNVLLKWLGESGTRAIRAAVAVSVPFVLKACARRLDRGFSKVYQWYLLRELRASLRRKFAHREATAFDPGQLGRWRTFREFDDRVTAPLHGFRDAADYYARSSCRPHLASIAVPTLILHARDDPFVPPDAIPGARELSPFVRLEITAGGGHTGFIARRGALGGHRWLEARIPAYLAPHLR